MGERPPAPQAKRARAASAGALAAIEFHEVLRHVAGFASSAAGRAAVLGRRPSPRASRVRDRLAAAAQTGAFLRLRHSWAFPRLPQSDRALARLAVDGSVLSAGELAEVGVLLRAGRSVRRALADLDDDLPALAGIAARVLEHPGIQAALERSVDAEGRILPTASNDLRRIRGWLSGAHGRVVAHLESLLRGLDDRHRVAEASVSIREGRYVIPVRREGRRAVGGYVHDESATGATLFVEPPSAIAMMNRVRKLERAERREELRILRSLADRCRSRAEGLAGSLAALAEFDALVAIARAASGWGGSAPAVAAGGPLRLRSGRHPLLVASGADVVPFDLELDPGERIVIVTGPNTGGKTVFLKSVGLIGALAQSGVPPPVGSGTRLPVFDWLFADVGDQQSIADSLSTFSAHLRNLREAVTGAGPRSLVLIDEPGAGTDPHEGEALARAVTESLAERGCTAVITSHLGGLKRLARPGGPVVNASLRFDGERLAPTYRFDKGRPGRSYGLAIARGLGFPADVIDRAEACRDRTEAGVDDLLRTLEAKERRAERLVAELEAGREELAAGTAALDAREAGVAAREEELRAAARDQKRRARSDARRLLMDARAEVDAAIARLAQRAEGAGRAGGGGFEAAARDARRAVETAARALEGGIGDAGEAAAVRGGGRSRSRRGRARARGAGRGAAARLLPGAAVRVAGLDAPGAVVAVEGDRVVVGVGGVRMTVDGDRVVPDLDGGGGAGREPPRGAGAGPKWGGMAASAATEVDLRGQRADEAELSLCRALDDASVADLRELRIIHGKGTGALRGRVRSVLEGDSRVGGFRDGRPQEGGYGVTLATLRP